MRVSPGRGKRYADAYEGGALSGLQPLPAGPALIRVSSAVSDLYDEISARHGLTRQQSRLLFVLHSRPSNMLGLGAELRLGKSTMTGVVGRMEAAGWVERTPDPRDRRNALLTPTDAGAQLAAAVEHELRDRVLGLLAPLDSADREALGGLLSRVLRRAEELLPPE